MELFKSIDEVKNSKLELLLVGYRKARNLDGQAFNARNQAGRLLQELSELILKGDKDVYEQVDALCDIQVFARNARALITTPVLTHYFTKANLHMGIFAELLGQRMVTLITCDSVRLSTRILDELVEITDIALTQLGYDAYECMLECIKEISARKQDPAQEASWKFNGPVGKWEKDKKQDETTLYKANYSIALLKGAI